MPLVLVALVGAEYVEHPMQIQNTDVKWASFDRHSSANTRGIMSCTAETSYGISSHAECCDTVCVIRLHARNTYGRGGVKRSSTAHRCNACRPALPAGMSALATSSASARGPRDIRSHSRRQTLQPQASLATWLRRLSATNQPAAA